MGADFGVSTVLRKRMPPIPVTDPQIKLIKPEAKAHKLLADRVESRPAHRCVVSPALCDAIKI